MEFYLKAGQYMKTIRNRRKDIGPGHTGNVKASKKDKDGTRLY